MSLGVSQLDAGAARPLPCAPPPISDEAREFFRARTLLVYDDKLYRRDADGYSCDEAHALFEIAMHRHFRRVTLCSRVRPGDGRGCYAVGAPNVDVCPLPYYTSVGGLMARSLRLGPRIWREVAALVERHDFVWLAWPHPVSLLALVAIARRPSAAVPFLVVRENMPEMVRNRYRGAARVAALATVRALLWQVRVWAERPLVFVVGDEMYGHYRAWFDDVHRITFPYFAASDLARRGPRRPPDGSLRLLYVGRLEPEKGLPVLLDGVALLSRGGRRVHLDVVGAGRDEAMLRDAAARLGLADSVEFHGYVPFGERLFERYRSADMLVLPSLSEGIPSVLLEATAFGLPFVASRVGGVSAFAAEATNGVLVDPGSANLLARAIASVADSVDGASPIGPPGDGVATMEDAQLRMLAALWRHAAGRERGRTAASPSEEAP